MWRVPQRRTESDRRLVAPGTARLSSASTASSNYSYASSVFSRNADRVSVASTSTDHSQNTRLSTASTTETSCASSVAEIRRLPASPLSMAAKKAENKFMCTHCDMTFTKTSDQRKHFKERCESLGTGVKAFQCSGCGNLSMTITQATRHRKDCRNRPAIITVTPTPKARFACGGCAIVFSNINAYHSHDSYASCVRINNIDHRFRLLALLQDGRSATGDAHTGMFADLVQHCHAVGQPHVPGDLQVYLLAHFTSKQSQTLANKLEVGVTSDQLLLRGNRGYRDITTLFHDVFSFPGADSNASETYNTLLHAPASQAVIAVPGLIGDSATFDLPAPSAILRSQLLDDTAGVLSHVAAPGLSQTNRADIMARPRHASEHTSFTVGSTSVVVPDMSTLDLMPSAKDQEAAQEVMTAYEQLPDRLLWTPQQDYSEHGSEPRSTHGLSPDTVFGVPINTIPSAPGSSMASVTANIASGSDDFGHAYLDAIGINPHAAAAKRQRPVSVQSAASDGTRRGAPVPRQDPHNDFEYGNTIIDDSTQASVQPSSEAPIDRMDQIFADWNQHQSLWTLDQTEDPFALLYPLSQDESVWKGDYLQLLDEYSEV